MDVIADYCLDNGRIIEAWLLMQTCRQFRKHLPRLIRNGCDLILQLSDHVHSNYLEFFDDITLTHLTKQYTLSVTILDAETYARRAAYCFNYDACADNLLIWYDMHTSKCLLGRKISLLHNATNLLSLVGVNKYGINPSSVSWYQLQSDDIIRLVVRVPIGTGKIPILVKCKRYWAPIWQECYFNMNDEFKYALF